MDRVGSWTVACHCSCTSRQKPVLSGSAAQMWFTNSSQYTSSFFPQSRSSAVKSRGFSRPNFLNTARRLRPFTSLAVASASRSVKSISVPLGSCMIITARWHARMKILRTSLAMSRSSSSETPSMNICASDSIIPFFRRTSASGTFFPAGMPHIFPLARSFSILLWPFCFPDLRYFSSRLMSCSTTSGPRSDHPCIITISHAIAVASRMSRTPNWLTLSGPYRYRSAICPATKTEILDSYHALRFTAAAPSTPTSSGTYTIWPVSSPAAKTRTLATSSKLGTIIATRHCAAKYVQMVSRTYGFICWIRAFSVTSSVSPTVPAPVALKTLDRRISSMTVRNTLVSAGTPRRSRVELFRSAAVLTMFSRSAPVNPAACLAMNGMFRSGSIIPAYCAYEQCRSMMSHRAARFGRGISTTRSNRPGRISAGSMTCGRFVAANTMIPEFPPNPSSSVSSWLIVATCSSFPWMSWLAGSARRTATESNSSMNTMHGFTSRACLNRFRIRDAPTPTNISMNSVPATEKNGTFASPARQRARSVFPVPGGPHSRTPDGITAPAASYLR